MTESVKWAHFLLMGCIKQDLLDQIVNGNTLMHKIEKVKMKPQNRPEISVSDMQICFGATYLDGIYKMCVFTVLR
jgi:hypothetical protein